MSLTEKGFKKHSNRTHCQDPVMISHFSRQINKRKRPHPEHQKLWTGYNTSKMVNLRNSTFRSPPPLYPTLLYMADFQSNNPLRRFTENCFSFCTTFSDIAQMVDIVDRICFSFINTGLIGKKVVRSPSHTSMVIRGCI